MNIFSKPQQTLLKKQSKELKKDLKSFKAKAKRTKKTNPYKKKEGGSYGEILVAKYLNSKSILFIREHPIPEISKYAKYPLRFDFYLPDLLTAIEFDGEQHFKSSIFDKKGCTLANRKERDRRKDFYCFTKGIEMIRISYKEIKLIDKILTEKLDR